MANAPHENAGVALPFALKALHELSADGLAKSYFPSARPEGVQIRLLCRGRPIASDATGQEQRTLPAAMG